MLAYVFWHWAQSEHAGATYERDLRAFHAALQQAAPAGFVSSGVFRLQGQAPWLGGEPAYADWYLVDGSAALDPLNVAAVSSMCEAPHTRVAHAMAGGAGSLFALRGEHAKLSAARHAYLLTKPRAMPYQDFYSAAEALPGSLWRRQMVLGPTPEFCLLTHAPAAVVDTFQPLRLDLRPL